MSPRNYKCYLPIERPLRSHCVALVTRDAVLYAELAPALRERRWPCVSLLPGQRIPERASVVLTSPSEVELIGHPRVLAVPPDGDRRALWAEVEDALGATPHPELTVGIDPGPRPGYAVLAGDRCIAQGELASPEEAEALGRHLYRRFADRALRFRVGSGAPLDRDRVVNALLPLHRTVELVDEGGTTPRGRRRPRDAEAARAIATHAGRPVHDRSEARPTPGEVSNLQRLSREHSGGRITIPRADAERVLRGELSLTDAIAARAPTARGVGPRGASTERP